MLRNISFDVDWGLTRVKYIVSLFVWSEVADLILTSLEDVNKSLPGGRACYSVTVI